MEWLKDLAYWHWWLLAGLFLLLEMWAPTYFFLWLGIAAAAVGFLILVVPDVALEMQFLAFGGLSVIAAIGWYRHRDSDS